MMQCNCIRFDDTNGFRIADLTCPTHGVAGTNPGDGYWADDDHPQASPDEQCKTCLGTGLRVTASPDGSEQYFGPGPCPACTDTDPQVTEGGTT